MRGTALALLIVAVIWAAVRWGTWIAGGSDSYCYVHQAERWAAFMRGAEPLQVAEPLALDAPWPDAAFSFAPAGHVPSSTVAGAIVPVCPSGLSIAMAPLVAVAGPGAAYYVMPLFGAMLIAATYVVGSRFGPRIGLASALVVACSPVFLFQVIQPMSDVPAAALWMLAVASATGTKRRSVTIAGLATSAAIVMRPNLVPLGVVIGLFLLFRPERSWPDRLRAASTYAVWCAPGCFAVAAIQQAFYGSPFSSGYGSLGSLFGLDHIVPNTRRYLSWLWQSHTPAVALAILAPWVLPGGLTALFIALIACNLALYLPYVVFEDWHYLRFLLPTLPLLLILVIAVVDGLWRRAGLRMASVAVATAAIVLGVLFVREARDRQAFRLQRLDARFERAGSFVSDRLPANALVITSWHSGSVRLYGGRKTLVWDGLHPEWLDRAIEYARTHGLEPFLLFESWEEPDFRQRFRGSDVARLDWPPIAEVAAQVRIYRPADRERYLQGVAEPTEYVP